MWTVHKRIVWTVPRNVLERSKCANSAWICGACDASPGPYSLFIIVSSPLLNFLARLTPLKTLNSGGTCSLLVPHPSDATEDAKLRCSPPWFLSFFQGNHGPRVLAPPPVRVLAPPPVRSACYPSHPALLPRIPAIRSRPDISSGLSRRVIQHSCELCGQFTNVLERSKHNLQKVF